MQKADSPIHYSLSSTLDTPRSSCCTTIHHRDLWRSCFQHDYHCPDRTSWISSRCGSSCQIYRRHPSRLRTAVRRRRLHCIRTLPVDTTTAGTTTTTTTTTTARGSSSSSSSSIQTLPVDICWARRGSWMTSTRLSTRGLWTFPTRGLWTFPTRGLWTFLTRGLSTFPTGGLWTFPTWGLCTFPTRGLWTFPTSGLTTFLTRGLWTAAVPRLSVGKAGSWLDGEDCPDRARSWHRLIRTQPCSEPNVSATRRCGRHVGEWRSTQTPTWPAQDLSGPVLQCR